MTTSYEGTLLARARLLAEDDVHDLADFIVTVLLGGARSAGLDPAAYAPLTGAALALGADQLTVYRAAGPPPASDAEFLSAVADAEHDARNLMSAAGFLAGQASTARRQALADLRAAEASDGDDRDALIADALARIGTCESALAELAFAGRGLGHAIVRLQAVPAALGETYEAVYDLIRSGGQMPYEGRWVTGEDPAGQQRRPISDILRDLTAQAAR